MAMLTLPQLAVSGVCILIATLAYGSQLLFLYLEPGPLKGKEWWCFNILVGCIWTSYARSCLVDPGDLAKAQPAPNRADSKDTKSTYLVNANQVVDRNGVRWCKKCEAYKPPRAHHCKICKRCIPKMDHHCPWTANCVSHRTLPHFVRFLVYASLSMTYLAGLQLGRISPIWHARYLPAYLGPSSLQLSALFLLSALNALTLFAVGIITLRTVYSLAINVTAVESWEIERHETLVRKARKHGGYLEGPDGQRVRIEKQEFPYDIGIWSNISQGMGGSLLPVVWAWPFAATPSTNSGMIFEENEFEGPDKTWPPPDPEKIAWRRRGLNSRIVGVDMLAEVRREVLLDGEASSDQERLRAFKERQDADLRRRGAMRSGTKGKESSGWRNAEGEALADFGVDDEEEGEAVDNADSESESSDSEYSGKDLYHDDDDIPLGELIARAKKKAA